jgi:hypothetical protein
MHSGQSHRMKHFYLLSIIFYLSTMNSPAIRTVLLLLHVAANFLLVNYLLRYDITGKWVYFIGFILLLFLLLFLFIKHMVSYIYFIKSKTK